MRVESQQLKAFLLDAGLVSAKNLEKAEGKAEKTKQKLPPSLYRVMASSYGGYQKMFLEKATVRKFRNVTKGMAQLSKDSVFNEKVDGLLEKLDVIKQRHQKVIH